MADRETDEEAAQHASAAKRPCLARGTAVAAAAASGDDLPAPLLAWVEQQLERARSEVRALSVVLVCCVLRRRRRSR
jgi:hypothetical protein